MQISKEALDLKYQLQELCKVQNSCICGFFIALYVVLSFFNIPISSIVEIRIGFLAFIAAGMMGGPVMGFTVGFLGDMLNCFVFLKLCSGWRTLRTDSVSFQNHQAPRCCLCTGGIRYQHYADIHLAVPDVRHPASGTSDHQNH